MGTPTVVGVIRLLVENTKMSKSSPPVDSCLRACWLHSHCAGWGIGVECWLWVIVLLFYCKHVIRLGLQVSVIGVICVPGVIAIGVRRYCGGCKATLSANAE
jgi:hypothetical protein